MSKQVTDTFVKLIQDLDAATADGVESFDQAVLYKEDEIALLIANGADVNAVVEPDTQSTLLHWIASFENLGLLKIVIEAWKAEPLKANSSSQTCLEIVIDGKHVANLDHLLSRDHIKKYIQDNSQRILERGLSDKNILQRLFNSAKIENYNIILQLKSKCINVECIKWLDEISRKIDTIAAIDRQTTPDECAEKIAKLEALSLDELFIFDDEGNTLCKKAHSCKNYPVLTFFCARGTLLKDIELDDVDKNEIQKQIDKIPEKRADVTVTQLVINSHQYHNQASSVNIESIYKCIYFGTDHLTENLAAFYLRPIMDAICLRPVYIRYDSSSPSTHQISPGAGTGTRGEVEPKTREIKFGVGGNAITEPMGTIIHEFTHQVCHDIWQNDCKPYYPGTNEEAIFTEIYKELLPKKDTLDPLILAAYNNYAHLGAEVVKAELIVRVPHLISQYGAAGLKTLQAQCPTLLAYYKDVVLSACNVYIESQTERPSFFKDILEEKYRSFATMPSLESDKKLIPYIDIDIAKIKNAPSTKVMLTRQDLLNAVQKKGEIYS